MDNATEFNFDLQLFGSKSTSTTTSTYTPTAYELQLQKSQADYADAVAPNALYLNDVARNLLQDSIGTVQVDYNTLNRNAQNQIANATGNLAGLTGLNSAAAATANDTALYAQWSLGTSGKSLFKAFKSSADMKCAACA